jgi:hypothetical protein
MKLCIVCKEKKPLYKFPILNKLSMSRGHTCNLCVKNNK